MTIMYYVLGTNLDIYVQAYFSAVSFYKQLTNNDRIVIVADNPAFFSRLSFAQIIPVDEKTITDWKGMHNFFWRTKIKAIDMVSKRYPSDSLLYMDCDTFLYGSLEAIKNQLQQGKSLMDGNEGHPSRTTNAQKRMFEAVKGLIFNDITISEKHDMWCAGVCGLPVDNRQKILDTALSLCDKMLETGADNVYLEQYALSIALFETSDLTSSKPHIAHYWSNKSQWLDVAKKMLLEAYFKDMPMPQMLNLLEKIPFEKIPIYLKHRQTNRRIKDFADKYFPNYLMTYINI